MIVFILPSREDYYVSNNTNLSAYFVPGLNPSFYVFNLHFKFSNDRIMMLHLKANSVIAILLFTHWRKKLIRNECSFTVSLIVSQTCMGSRIGSHKIMITMMTEE